jgi:hypothetical protein
MLLFKKGSVLNSQGLEKLKIYTANCYGLNKLAYKDRLKWTNDNIEKIISVPKIKKSKLIYFLDPLIENSRSAPQDQEAV